MKIFDCFMYFDEEVILDLRLNILNPYIDYFIIVESSYTHKGDKRNLKFLLKVLNKFKIEIRIPSFSVLRNSAPSAFNGLAKRLAYPARPTKFSRILRPTRWLFSG